jgi:UDP-3-O-[3-hydroxymyristoyl] glucosamine N-acyltransferase
VKKTVTEIAQYLSGDVIGDKNAVIRDIKGIDEAKEGDLTFIANTKYLKRLETTSASAVLVSPDVKGAKAPKRTLIVVKDPYASMARVLALFYPRENDFSAISSEAYLDEESSVAQDAIVYPRVFIGKRARIESRAVLYPGVVIGADTVIGEDSILYPNVTVYRRCLIGKRVILHAGVVIGSDGFGYADPGRENLKVPQAGIVQIDDDVEIGANTTIDRGTLGKTWIQKGTKIDNLVQIAHNVEIGENSIIASQVGISGSTKLGRGVVVGGQVGFVGHITVGNHVMIAAKSGISKDIPANRTVAGVPAIPHTDWLRLQGAISRLPITRGTVTTLLKRVEELEKKLEK